MDSYHGLPTTSIWFRIAIYENLNFHDSHELLWHSHQKIFFFPIFLLSTLKELNVATKKHDSKMALIGARTMDAIMKYLLRGQPCPSGRAAGGLPGRRSTDN